MRRIALATTVTSLAFVLGTARAADVVLVENGVSKAPIIVPENAPPATVQAANELANYIEKISGARPAVVVGNPDPTPASAIWVGFQPRLTGLFPDVKFDFENPEEILIVCNGQNVVIAGRDRKVGETETECGTANAVYTFLQKYLGVRWLWPGPLGEDVVKRESIALSPVLYRYAPQFRQRDVVMHWVFGWYEFDPERRDQLIAWVRFQRILFYSLDMDTGHPLTGWWDKYHAEHPDYFALQPDGTRSGYPGPALAKLCQSNPKVEAQWLDNAAEALQKDPSLQTFGAAANDWAFSGVCVCGNCRAWDDPDAPLCTYDYANGKTEKYVIMTQRYVTSWNRMARGLKERFPDRQLYVVGSAYGASMQPPTKAVLEDNIIIPYAGHFPFTTEAARREQKAQWQGWAQKAHIMVYRPNLWYFGGGGWGFPEVAMTKTIEDFRFLAENRCVGIAIDMNRSFWATHGPQYYLMAQLAWDPLQDGRALLNDYYRRGFGPAAGEIESYWNLMEKARDALVDSPGFAVGHANRFRLPAIFEHVYSNDLLNQANELLAQAAAKAAPGPAVYAKRVAFVRSGFEVTNLLARTIPIMTKVRESGGKDVAAVKQAMANWEAMDRICQEAGPLAVRLDHIGIRRWLTEDRYMGGMQDYLGPPSAEFRKAAGVPEARPDPQ